MKLTNIKGRISRGFRDSVEREPSPMGDLHEDAPTCDPPAPGGGAGGHHVRPSPGTTPTQHPNSND